MGDMAGRRGLLCTVVLAWLVSVAGPLPVPARADGGAELLSFGNSANGALGRRPDEDGDLGSTPTPLQLPGQVGAVVQVASAGSHTLVVTSSGQLYAFGDNYWGELGGPLNFRRKLPNPQPTLVPFPAGATIVQAAAGGGFSMALTDSGQLFAFGEDRAGQLGLPLGTGENGNAEPVPSTVAIPASDGRVVAIAAGATFGLALTASGRVYSFGENHDGQLGQPRNEGGEEANPTPAPVQMPAGASPVTQIAAGRAHTLAVAAGQLYGWGEDMHGQTGDAANLGTDKPNPVPHAIALPGAVGAIAQIAAGSEHSLALTTGGQVYSFGTNSSGQLGRPSVVERRETPNPTPAPVVLPAAAGVATRIATGGDQSFVQTSAGEVYGVGSNLYGELGVLTNIDDGGSYRTPFALTLPGLSNLTLLGGDSSAGATFLSGDTQPSIGAPALSGLTITSRAFPLDAHGHRCFTPWGVLKGHRCSRTTPLHIAYTLSAPGAVQFVLERQAGSILRDGTCQQEGASRHHPRCRFLVLRGRFRRAGVPGAQAFDFDGYIERRALEPGTYRLTAFAQAGQQAGTAQTVWFEVAA
jgi:alpha-tubulin suppressor-like RCC1 family protein